MEECEIKKMFLYRVTSGLKMVENDTVRLMFCDLALRLNNIMEDGQEKTQALLRLQEAQYWALASLKMKDIRRVDLITKE
jgi:hypothetical protein